MKLPIWISLSALVITLIAVPIKLHEQVMNLKHNLQINAQQLTALNSRLTALESENQYVKNQQLTANLNTTHQTFLQTSTVYEKLVDAGIQTKTTTLNKNFAVILKDLSDLNYASATTQLTKLNSDIDSALTQSAPGINTTTLVTDTNPPDSGYRRQVVSVDGQNYVVDIATGDLSTTKVVVDTASDSTCSNNCPVLPLADYATRNNAWAAVNGSYFCPDTYPQCVGKTNSFDLLLMNKNKIYFNSDNNIYSTNPAVIFTGSSVRFVGKAQEWGRDTGIDSMISNFPLLLMNKSLQFGGNDDAKMTGLSTRGFVASKGGRVYIGMVHSVTVVNLAKVLQMLGMDNAINLDDGGSAAMWVSGRYTVGPGRNIPNAILFLKK